MFFQKIAVRLWRRPRIVWLTSVGVAMLGLLNSVPTSAQSPAPLTMSAALLLAEQRSQQLSAQDSVASAARELAIAAAQLPDPVLKAGINNLPINGSDQFSLTRDFMTMRYLGFAQEITRREKLQTRSTRFEREVQAAAANRRLIRAGIHRETAQAWLDRYFADQMQTLLTQQRDQVALQIEAADAAYRGGRAAQGDVLAARVARAQIEDRIALAQREVATATSQLARWIGAAATAPLGEQPSLDAVRIGPEDISGRLTHHPQLQTIASQQELAQAEVDVAVANQRSDWSVEVMYAKRGPSYSDMVSFGVSIPLQWDQANRQDRELAAKRAVVAQRLAEHEEATRAHVAETQAMLQAWQGNRERLQRYDRDQVPLASERTRAALAAYRGSAGTLAAVLEARRGEIDTRIDRLRLAMETARLWAQLNFLIPDPSGPP